MIESLFLRTYSGATYIQVAIIVLLLILMLIYLIDLLDRRKK